MQPQRLLFHILQYIFYNNHLMVIVAFIVGNLHRAFLSFVTAALCWLLKTSGLFIIPLWSWMISLRVVCFCFCTAFFVWTLLLGCSLLYNTLFDPLYPAFPYLIKKKKEKPSNKIIEKLKLAVIEIEIWKNIYIKEGNLAGSKQEDNSQSH
jgi:hypothetical protein